MHSDDDLPFNKGEVVGALEGAKAWMREEILAAPEEYLIRKSSVSATASPRRTGGSAG